MNCKTCGKPISQSSGRWRHTNASDATGHAPTTGQAAPHQHKFAGGPPSSGEAHTHNREGRSSNGPDHMHDDGRGS